MKPSLIISILVTLFPWGGFSQSGFNEIYPHQFLVEDGAQIEVVDGEIKFYSVGLGSEDPQVFYSQMLIDPESGEELEFSILELAVGYAFGRESVTRVGEDLWVWSGDSGFGACVYAWNDDFELVWEIQQETGEYSQSVLLENGNLLCWYKDWILNEFEVHEYTTSGELVNEIPVDGIENFEMRDAQFDVLPNGYLVITGRRPLQEPDISYENSDNVVVVLDESYNLLWEDSWGGVYTDGPCFVEFSAADNQLICVSSEILHDEDFGWGLYAEFTLRRFDIETGAYSEIVVIGPDDLILGELMDIHGTIDGGIVVIGFGYASLESSYCLSFMTKFDSSFQEEWTRTYAHLSFEEDPNCRSRLRDVEPLEEGGYVLGGSFADMNTDDPYNDEPWLIVTDECGLIQQDCTISVPSLPAADIKVFPNPTGGWLNIPQEFIGHNFRLVNAEGKVVGHGQLTFAGFDLTEFNEGLYVLSIEQDNGNWVNTSVVKK
ncbi:hypothetical protein [Sanyastnella coralliicola]|uniref:hypothetical protein n=1 Tax=Sanyastnella coralliicola TaxID=3069118 RepID=UPI0027BA4350|nr:hypothetical protein [Longitalea sp. SCSIO 12813]